MYYIMCEEKIGDWIGELLLEDKTPSEEEAREFAEKLFKEAKEMAYEELAEECYYAMRRLDKEILARDIYNGIKERISDELTFNFDEVGEIFDDIQLRLG